MTAEILAVARRHMAADGAAALSLRSVARDLEMAPSALYRYFDGRDALLSALILGAYQSLAAEAEQAAQAAASSGGSDTERWLAVPRAMRAWALAHPNEWGLIFGTPVPGYRAPQQTVEPYAAIAGALVRPVIDAREAGRLHPGEHSTVSTALAAAVVPVREALFPEMPVDTVVRAVEAWTTIVGAISLEVFGHWRNTVLDPDELFEATARDVASSLGLS
jgi:AcrR family transcriptional regulator